MLCDSCCGMGFVAELSCALCCGVLEGCFGRRFENLGESVGWGSGCEMWGNPLLA